MIQGLREYSGLVGLPGAHRWAVLAAGLMAVAAPLWSTGLLYFLPIVVLLAAVIVSFLAHDAAVEARHASFAVLGWTFVAFALAHLVLIHTEIDGGVGILLMVGTGVALSDVCAYAVGSRFGRHRLAPRVSPNQTWEGVVGNVIGAFVGVGLMTFAAPQGSWPSLLLGLPVVIAVGTGSGDLLESKLKREFRAKDSGTWLPGFGGILNRIDSLLPVTPLAYYLIRLVG